MTVQIVTVTAALATFSINVIWFLKKAFAPTADEHVDLYLVHESELPFEKAFAPAKERFPSCRECNKYMDLRTFHKSELPFEMVAYLHKWNLPEKVIRRHICPDFHSQLWIAPPVGDMEKSLFVSR